MFKIFRGSKFQIRLLESLSIGERNILLKFGEDSLKTIGGFSFRVFCHGHTDGRHLPHVKAAPLLIKNCFNNTVITARVPRPVLHWY